MNNRKTMIVALLMGALAGCQSTQWQSVATPLSTSGIEGLAALAAGTPDDTFTHDYPSQSPGSVWQAMLVVMSQEGLIVAVNEQESELLVMVDGSAPPMKIRLDEPVPGTVRAHMGWYRSVYAIPQESYALLEAPTRPTSAVPEWGNLQVISERLMGQIATQAYARQSWRFLRTVE